MPPDVMSFSAAISACEKGAQWERAVSLLNDPSSDVIRFNAAIWACEKGAQWQRAVSLFNDLGKAHMSPDVISYMWSFRHAKSMCCGSVPPRCSMIGQGTHATRCDELQRGHLGVREGCAVAVCRFLLNDLSPDVISFNAATSSCEKGRQWQHALSLLNFFGKGADVTRCDLL